MQGLVALAFLAVPTFYSLLVLCRLEGCNAAAGGPAPCPAAPHLRVLASRPVRQRCWACNYPCRVSHPSRAVPAAAKRQMVAFAVDQQTALVEAGEKPSVTPPMLAVRHSPPGPALHAHDKKGQLSPGFRHAPVAAAPVLQVSAQLPAPLTSGGHCTGSFLSFSALAAGAVLDRPTRPFITCFTPAPCCLQPV